MKFGLDPEHFFLSLYIYIYIKLYKKNNLFYFHWNNTFIKIIHLEYNICFPSNTILHILNLFLHNYKNDGQ